MTPEQKANLPQHPHPRAAEERERAAATERACSDIRRMQLRLRALRVLRASMEYPSGHPERAHLPGYVRTWESEMGPAPESARRVLEATERKGVGV